jgi:hypothetical protein
MVLTWSLVLAFIGGGYAGFLLCAMLSISRDRSEDEHPLISRHRVNARAAVKEVA